MGSLFEQIAIARQQIADVRLDLTDIRDDGNDPLRHLIARACGFIEAARRDGGCVLVHCVSGYLCLRYSLLIPASRREPFGQYRRA